ncbi:MAG: hypothetical protein IH623_04705 [Verrucomicrobia bacterium]|nr:hypothetical protein [Verrucomicrobiota bacterium]
MEGRFRGQLPRSQIPKECKILTQKGADLIIFLRDSNLENWRDVLRADEAKCPTEFRHRVIFGVCDRNAECWLAKAPDHLSAKKGCSRAELNTDDPSPVVKKAFGLVGFDKEQQEPVLAAYVRSAPLKQWLQNKSFENFYEQLWHQSQQKGCTLENLR